MIIDRFDGEYFFLSNFAESPFTASGKTWPTVEHAFQAAKTVDEQEQETIRQAPTPGEAKHLGKRVKLRANWEAVKQEVMLTYVRLKFQQHPELAEELRQTGDARLIEGNTWHDNTWGDCSCKRCQAIQGKNLLGQILMRVRAELQELRVDENV